MSKYLAVAVVVATLLSGQAQAGERLNIGGDAYVTGTSASLAEASPRDAFLSGFSATLTGRVEKDVAAAGFDVNIDAPVGGDVYAGGFSLDFAQPIGEDLTAAGFNIHLRDAAPVAGNARLSAGSMVLDGPIAGSLVAAAGSLTLNNTIAGDARLTVGKIEFGPAAKINGTLTYSARAPLEIPAGVISPDRVHFEKLDVTDTVGTVGDTMQRGMPRLWPTFFAVLFAVIFSIAFLVVAAAVLFAFMPDRMERLKDDAIAAPVRSMVLGVLGLSASIGLVPVSAMTLIGIPLIPIAMLAIMALWIAGYIVGAYALATRVLAAFRETPATAAGRIFTLAVGLVVIALLNFIPFLGWIINLAVVFLGLGAIVGRILRRLVLRDEAIPVATLTAAPANQPKARRTRR